VRPVIIRQQRARARRDWRAKLGRVGARRISAQRLPALGWYEGAEVPPS
jgi:hypothetical protein